MIYPAFDAGTTCSVFGYLNAQGIPSLVPDASDADVFDTPSAVHVSRRSAWVGRSALELLEDNPSIRLARGFKRWIGFEEPAYIDASDTPWHAEALTALVLRKLLRDGAIHLSDELGPAVMTVPARFNDRQRAATKAAARMAGMADVSLVEEPVAAAAFHGFGQAERERTVLVYDLGGGSFEATVLQTSPGGHFVLATEGLWPAGGGKFNDALMELLVARFGDMHGFDPRRDPVAVERLAVLSEEIKLRLACSGQAQVTQSVMLAGCAFEVLVTRRDFETAIRQSIEETFACVQRCLQSVALDWSDIDTVLLTGGSTLLPQIQTRMLEISGKPANQVLLQKPRHAVAYGAAILAAARGGNDPGLVRGIASHGLGLRVWDRSANRPGIEILIPQNAPLPARYSRVFYTTRDDQARMILEFVQTREGCETPVSLGVSSFGPIEQPRRNTAIEVTVHYAADGTISVHAVDPANGLQLERIIEGQMEGDQHIRAGMAQVAGVRINEH